MSYIAPISHEERLKLEGAPEVVEQPVEAPAEEVVVEEPIV